MANEKNLEKRVKFSTANQPAKRGRRKSQIGDFIADNHVSLEDLRKILQGLIFTRTVPELEALKKDGAIPAVIPFVVSAVLDDMRRGRLDALNSLFDRVYGKPAQISIVEVHDMPEETKQKMLSIFNTASRSPVKPKLVTPRKVLKPGA